VLVLVVCVSSGAAPADLMRVDNWTEYPIGAPIVTTSGQWKVYSSMTAFKYPPTIVLDNDRRVLRLKTDHETMAVGRPLHLDVTPAQTLRWEWKPLGLPVDGDVRESAAKRNDQAARLVLWFDVSLFLERRAIGYIWNALVGTVVRQRGPATERALVVVRSGPSGLGTWHREARNVYQDYRDTPFMMSQKRWHWSRWKVTRMMSRVRERSCSVGFGSNPGSAQSVVERRADRPSTALCFDECDTHVGAAIQSWS